jgi:hypothetical protein
MNAVSKIVKDLMTGKSGEDHDIGKYSWLGSSVVITVAGIWNAVHGVTFDLVQVASAFGIIAGAHGGALALKSKTEPEKKEL